MVQNYSGKNEFFKRYFYNNRFKYGKQVTREQNLFGQQCRVELVNWGIDLKCDEEQGEEWQ